jgi:hypothetical protein
MKGRSVPILFLANKMDLSNSMGSEEIVSALELESLGEDNKWKIL